VAAGWLRHGRSLGLSGFRGCSRDGEETASTKKHWSKISVCPSDVNKK